MKEAGKVQENHSRKAGERIAEARQALGLKLEDIAERTRIPLRHLEAIETSNFNVLPAPTYSVGFVKTYAKTVGLDAEAIGADFRSERGAMQAPRPDLTPFEPADPSRVPPRLLATIAFATALLLAVFYLVWRGGAGVEEQQLAAGTAPTAPSLAAPAAPAPSVASAKPLAPTAPAAADRVELVATDTIWIKVSEKNGPTLFMGALNPGQSYVVPADARDPRLLTGRPYALRVKIGATTFPTISPKDTTIRDISLKAPALAVYAKAEADAARPKSNAPAARIGANPGQRAD